MFSRGVDDTAGLVLSVEGRVTVGFESSSGSVDAADLVSLAGAGGCNFADAFATSLFCGGGAFGGPTDGAGFGIWGTDGDFALT